MNAFHKAVQLLKTSIRRGRRHSWHFEGSSAGPHRGPGNVCTALPSLFTARAGLAIVVVPLEKYPEGTYVKYVEGGLDIPADVAPGISKVSPFLCVLTNA